VPLFTSGGLNLGLGLKNFVLFTSQISTSHDGIKYESHNTNSIKFSTERELASS